MVIRGATRGNGAQLAGYLVRQADNDNIRVFDIRGTSQLDDLKSSLVEMSLTSELTASEKGLYHAQINPAYGDDRKMQPNDWLKAAAILEQELNLTDQKRVIVLHEKKGRTHAHVVWERYDHDKGVMISDSFSRLAQDRARKTMEKELVQQQTPHRNTQQPEMKKLLTELWKKTRSGAEFVKEAIAKGYLIAKGEQRRPYMVVDALGRSFDLTRQLKDVRTREVRERLKNEKLPTEKEAILLKAQVRQHAQEKLKEPPSLPQQKTMSEMNFHERDFVMKKLVEEKKAELGNEKIETEKERLKKELREQLNRSRERNRLNEFDR